MLGWFTGMEVSVLLYRTGIWDSLFFLPFIAAFSLSDSFVCGLSLINRAGLSQGLDFVCRGVGFSFLCLLCFCCIVEYD